MVENYDFQLKLSYPMDKQLFGYNYFQCNPYYESIADSKARLRIQWNASSVCRLWKTSLAQA